jgi:preprotein translocase subunit SecY
LLDRRRVLVTALCLVVWRSLEQVPLAEVNTTFMTVRLYAPNPGGLFHAIGGSSIPFASYSLGSIGIRSYIYALMVVSLVPVISGRVAAMRMTVEGRVRLERWTRALALVLSLGQAYGFTLLMQTSGILPPNLDWFARLVVCLELASGTMIVLWLADLLDEFGLGFGYAAFVLYALGPVGLQVHRLADYATLPWPPLATFFKASALWAAVSVAVVVATVAFVRAIRVVRPPAHEKLKDRGTTVLNLLPSGVLRPPAFATAMMFLPPLYAGYVVSSHPEVARWITEFLMPYGPHVWNYALYLAVTSCLIVAFAVVVVGMDHSRTEIPAYLRRHMKRLAFIGGCFLALTVELVPFLERIITNAAGDAIPMSGFDAVLVVVVILAILTATEGRPAARTVVASPLP